MFGEAKIASGYAHFLEPAFGYKLLTKLDLIGFLWYPIVEGGAT